MRSLAALLGATCVVVTWSAAASVVAAAPGDGDDPAQPSDEQILDYLWTKAKKALERASEEHEPVLNPPKPVKVRWRARRIWSGRLGAPLLDVTAVDVDGDKRVELVALTTSELLVLRLDRSKARVLARIKLSGKAASIRPRSPIGAVVARVRAEGIELVARASGRAKASVFAWKSGRLVEKSSVEGFPLCDGVMAKLERGRNYFSGGKAVSWSEGVVKSDMFAAAVPQQFFAARCKSGMVDAKGRGVRVFSILDTSGKLVVVSSKTCRSTDAACRAKPETMRSVRGVGTAFVVADIDNDGSPEVITSTNRAPGARDRVMVRSGSGAKRIVFRRNFIGGIAGLAAGDADGDGDQDVLAVVRLIGQERVGVWALNK